MGIKEKLLIYLPVLLFSTCQLKDKVPSQDQQHGPGIIILGIAQDGGAPHIGCQKACCEKLRMQNRHHRVVSLGLIDPAFKKSFLFEATPDITSQLESLHKARSYESASYYPDGIFITHAHTGHYSGLMYLGREAAGADNVPVYVMPGMKRFIEKNGPWDQLTRLQNIEIHQEQAGERIPLTGLPLAVTPFIVPHRDEYSETAGYLIDGYEKRALFIPDINKWQLWDRDIAEEVKKADYAFIDATFYDQDELPGRDMSEIPHPFVVETMQLFRSMPPEEKNKIYFIHMNHSNPLLDSTSAAYQKVLSEGFHVAREGQWFGM